MEKKNGITGLKEFGQKIGGTAIDVFHKAQDVGQKTAASVQKGAVDLSDKMKRAGYANRMKKYNPLFPEVYNSEGFNNPNLVTIVDDAVRRGIDVCEGAIGWLGKAAGTEVLYLYDEAIPESGLSFVPTAQCDAIYYVHPFDRKKFVRIDHIFYLAHEERLAELKHIAHALGAKRCVIESFESTNTATEVQGEMREKRSLGKKENDGEAVEVRRGERIDHEHSSENARNQAGKIIVEMVGNENPQMPELKWYAHDNNILGLIAMRMAKEIYTEQYELSGASSSTMSHKTACVIDSAVKDIELDVHVSMEAQVRQEHSRKLYYKIDF